MMSSRIVRPALAAARRTAPRTALRTYAAAAGPDNSRPPVAVFGLDGTYASALVCYTTLCSSQEPATKQSQQSRTTP